MSKLCVCIIYLQYHTEWRIWHDTRDTRQLQCHNMTLHTTNLHLQMFSNNKKRQLLIKYFFKLSNFGSFRIIRRRPLLAPSPCCKHLPLLITHYCVQAVVVSMSRYIPVRTTMDSEDHYHAPYDTHDARGDSDAHYEAPSCLKRNPSGSLFIPSGEQKH